MVRYSLFLCAPSHSFTILRPRVGKDNSGFWPGGRKQQEHTMFDVAINNGTLIDPARNIHSKLNLGIRDGKVAAVSRETLAGEAVIDAAGLVVCPGFVDMHMHEDAFDAKARVFDIKIFDCMLRMGVTTAVGGNCGIAGGGPAEYLAAADAEGLPVNVALYAAHGEMRKQYCPDLAGTVSDADIANMAHDLEAQLAAGCVGVSFGLRYVPGTSEKELNALAKVAARHGKLLAAHARDDAAGIIGAAQELLDLAAREKTRLQISHIGSMAAYGQMEELLSMVDAACHSGLDVGLDCYPYNAFCTAIGSATYAPGFLERYGIGYETVEVAGGTHRGKRCDKALFDEVRGKTPEILAVAHVMREHEVDMALAHPRTVMASDGILVGGFGHPRAAGSFPRFLHQYVKTKRTVSLNEAIAKMTVLPAARVGLDKGRLAVGDSADVVIFDYAAVQDMADFANPLTPPLGIRRVLIGGETALEDGKICSRVLGKAVRA